MKQNHMKGKARGSVLFTVITVMMIMVVFLMSTLILTTASHRRSYYTYYETQAQYAAQAALDAVTNYAYSDASFSQWVQGISDDDPHDFYVQFDGSTLPLSDTSIAGADHYVVCTVQRDEPKYVWDDVTNAIRETEGWRITATAFVGRGRNQASYQMVNHIYANIKTDNAAGTQNALTYLNYQWDQANADDDEGDDDDDNDIDIVANAVYTLSVMNTGSEGNIMVLGPQYSGMADLPVGRINYNNSSTPCSSFSNNNAVVGNAMYVNNMSSAVEMQVTFQKPGESVSVYGNVSASNTNGLVVNSYLSNPTNNYTKLNYVYIDGTLIGGNSGYSFGMGTGSSPVNLFAGAIDAQGNRTVAVNGDIYLYDPELESKIGANGSGATILSTFLANNIEGKDSSTNAKLGNLISNNKKLTLGNGATTTIAGDVYYTNPAGSVEISGTVNVSGKVYFACGPDKVSNAGNIHATGGIVYNATTVAGYGDYYPADYSTNIPSANYDFRLFPFAYRLDEIFSTYYRWDLAGNDEWEDDALVKESKAAGHTWNTKTFYAGVATGSSPYIEEILTVDEANARLQAINPSYSVYWYDSSNAALAGISIGSAYWDGERGSNVVSWKSENPNYDPDDVTEVYIAVPYTTPVTASHAFMEPFEPVVTSSAGSIAQGIGGDSTMGIDTYDAFVGRYGAAKTTIYNSANISQTSKNVTYFYAIDDSNSLGYKNENVYFINESCTINVSGISGTILVDNTSADGEKLGIVLEGEFSNDLKLLTNNTAYYDQDETTGNVTLLSVYGPTTYTQDITENGSTRTVKGNGAYAARTDVFFFLKSGFGTAEKDTATNKNFIISTGIYDAAANVKFDIVANPLYPGQDGYSALTNGEQWKFMLVPNSVMLGQSGSNYALANIFISSAMLLYNSSVSRGGMYYAVASGNTSYREEHDSTAYTATFTDQNGNASTKNFMCAGMTVVATYNVKNLPMIAFIGDANRPGEKQPKENPDPTYQTSGSGDNSDPNATDGKDYFSNQYQGAS